MKKLLAALLLALFIPSTSYAMTHQQVESLVRWAGCKATVITDEGESILGSYYTYAEQTMYIGLANENNLTDNMTLIVIFHETGHCLQDQLGYMRSLWEAEGTVAVELDADRWAAQLACGYHMDGRQLLHDVFVWAMWEYGYHGDYSHGSLWERISQGNKADYCNVTTVESP